MQPVSGIILPLLLWGCTLDKPQDTANPLAEICDDGSDNDGDGATDCADTDCMGGVNCGGEDCSNGIDDNNNGTIDCADSACEGNEVCIEDCEDGLDNDADGTID